MEKIKLTKGKFSKKHLTTADFYDKIQNCNNANAMTGKKAVFLFSESRRCCEGGNEVRL